MKGFKTILVNSAIAILPVVDYIANNGALISAVTGGQATAVVSAIGLLNVALRFVTSTPALKGE